MQEFASGFQHLEKELKSGTLAEVSEQAGRISRHATALSKLQNSVKPDQQSAFATHLDSLQRLSGQLSTRAASGENQYTRWYVEEIRNTCVSCHASLRDLTNVKSPYPARGNTVIVDVSASTAAGQQLADNSGSIVFIDGLVQAAGRNDPHPVISQQNRQFSPRVLPIVRGTTVDFPNDDSILHNVFSLSKARRFDLDVYRPGKSKSTRFSKPGLVRIYCNIHPEMTCSVLVLNNPYFATTDANGRCIISGIPDGTFSLRTWRELGGEARQSVRLNDSKVVKVALKVREAKQSLAHRNKYGLPYSKVGKYK